MRVDGSHTEEASEGRVHGGSALKENIATYTSTGTSVSGDSSSRKLSILLHFVLYEEVDLNDNFTSGKSSASNSPKHKNKTIK